jgi:hypothetical protein
MLEVVAGSVRRAEERGKARARGLVLLAALPRPHRTVLEDGGAAQLNPLQAVQHLLPRQHKSERKQRLNKAYRQSGRVLKRNFGLFCVRVFNLRLTFGYTPKCIIA